MMSQLKYPKDYVFPLLSWYIIGEPKKIVPGSSTRTPKNRFIFLFSNCPFQLKTERDPRDPSDTTVQKFAPIFSEENKIPMSSALKIPSFLMYPFFCFGFENPCCSLVFKRNCNKKKTMNPPPSPSSTQLTEVRRIATWPFP